MRCKQCDYSLWNLKARQCPECGRPFAPSEYEFAYGAVKFCCPHCEQCYYGTDARGHLTPRQFVCVTCGQQIDMDEMVLRPADGLEDAQTQANIMPWLQRERMGFFKGWFKTVIGSMISPGRIMSAVPLDRGAGEVWWFAAITLFLVSLIGVGLPFGAIGLFLFVGGDSEGLEMMLMALCAVTLAPAATLLLVALWGLTAHGLLRVTGGTKHSIGRTYQALLYSAGTQAPLAVPCAGPYCGSCVLWIWWAVSAILMLMAAQGVRGGRASLAVLAFPITCTILFVASYVLMIVMFISQAPTFSSTATFPVQLPINETSTVVNGLTAYAAKNNNTLPQHAAQLIISRDLTAQDFIGLVTGTIEQDVPLADTTLDEFQYLSPRRQDQKVQAVIRAMPENVVAHRLGDYVFTYHGATLAAAEPELWLVVMLPDPNVNELLSEDQIWIGKRNGSVVPATIAELPALTEQQNQLRARLGLPSLPDLTTVTHDAPAVAE